MGWRISQIHACISLKNAVYYRYTPVQGGDPVSAESIRMLLAPVFSRYPIRRAILFDSYAKGTQNAKSDVDLLVDCDLRGLRFVGFMEEIHQTLSLPVDVFDVTHIEKGSRIEEEIRRTGVTIYER